MADNFDILGQLAPGTTLSDIYTVPPGKRATVKVVVANRSGAGSFRVAVSPLLAAIANEHYIAYDKPLDANDALVSSAIELGAGCIVRVRGSSANISFTVSGLEEDDI